MVEVRDLLVDKGLKVTPQRIAILEAIHELKNHPTAENVIDHIRKVHPNIASGTVYKVLDTLVKSELIKKVTTEKDIMRYDGMVNHHHHLYCTNCDMIEDYIDEDLNDLLKKYFENKKINGFQVKDFELQIKGTFDKC
jgi:Fur family peroxide stress response transcriptional regulator